MPQSTVGPKNAGVRQRGLPWPAGLFITTIAATSVFNGVARADVYVSDAPGFGPRFANHQVDPSYRLMLQDPAEVERVASRAPAIKRFAVHRSKIDTVIAQVAARLSVDASLVRAVIEIESRFNPNALSPKGAVGPMQLMPQTARRYGAGSRYDPIRNIEAGVAYLKDLLARYGGNVALALAAYNSGEGAVARYRNVIPPFRETMLYVPQVLEAYARYRDEASQSTAAANPQ